MAVKRKSLGALGMGEKASLAEGSTRLDVEALRQVVEILDASDVSELKWRRGDEELVVRRGAVAGAAQVLPGPVTATREPAEVVQLSAARQAPAHRPAAESQPGFVVTSPFVGTFYRSPAPDQPHFVEVGSLVKKGQALCIVEAMKLMNEIEAERDGKVAEILVQNGQAVEFGQPLFRLEP